MRLFAATIATETNTFSPLPTSLEAYKECVFLRPGEHPDDTPLMCTAPLWVARKRAKAEGFTLIEGSCFAASPAGTTNRKDYEFMRDEILDQLKAAMPVDGVLLGLHGAMVAHGYEDVEGDIIERARAIVGPKCVIGVELDPHCHLTLRRVKFADIIVLYKEFPHTDVVERAEDVLNLVLRTIRGEIKPVTSVYDCRQIQSYPTTLPLMRAFVDRMIAMEGKNGILSISIGHCFPYADVPEMTGRILVIVDGDKKQADKLATEIGEEFVAMRGKTMPDYLDVDGGISAAMAFNAAEACAQENTALLRLEREAWRAGPGDRWTEVDTLDEAAVNLRRGVKRVLIAVGRQELAPFVSLDDIWFLIRSVEAPEPMPEFKKYELLLSRGPFDVADERQLLRDKRIDTIVCKNSGGTATQAKLIAARELGIQVIMKRRPPRPELPTASTIDDALAWLKLR
ncbi:MAG: precorrin-6A/cobalt-precorrin-6A reductase [Alphaproteobacteria bacterium]|nr:precorrin-6A/cobalt-precorrin-6A reductase [Alphaproteobacteria bacterium]